MNINEPVAEPTAADFESLQLEAPEKELLRCFDAPLQESELAGVADREIIARWSRDADARRAAKALYFSLLSGD